MFTRRALMTLAIAAICPFHKRGTKSPTAAKNYGVVSGLDATLMGDLHLYGNRIHNCTFDGFGTVVLHVPDGQPGMVTHCRFNTTPDEGRHCVEFA